MQFKECYKNKTIFFYMELSQKDRVGLKWGPNFEKMLISNFWGKLLQIIHCTIFPLFIHCESCRTKDANILELIYGHHIADSPFMMLYMMRSKFERLVYMPIFKTTFHDSSFCKKKSICTSKKIHISILQFTGNCLKTKGDKELTRCRSK